MLNYMLTISFITLPEAIVVFLMGFRLCNIQVSGSKLLSMTFFQCIVAFAVKVLNIHLGLHTMIQIVSMYLLVILFSKIESCSAAIPVMIGAFVQGIIQIVAITIISSIWKIDPTKLNSDFQSAFFVFIPVLIASIILLEVIKRSHFVLCEIQPKDDDIEG